MATRYQVLGQVAPDATTATTLYTVPSGKDAVVSTIIVANRGAVDGIYRIAVRPSGATLANHHYLAYDVSVGPSDSTTITIGITLAATDVITIYSATADLSFSAFGSVVDQ